MVDEDHVDIHRQPQQNLDGQVQSGAALHRELRLLENNPNRLEQLIGSFSPTRVGMVRKTTSDLLVAVCSPHPRWDGPVKRHRVLFGLDERPQPIVLDRLPSPARRDLGKPPQTVPGGLRLSLGSAAEQWAESWLQRNLARNEPRGLDPYREVGGPAGPRRWVRSGDSGLQGDVAGWWCALGPEPSPGGLRL